MFIVPRVLLGLAATEACSADRDYGHMTPGQHSHAAPALNILFNLRIAPRYRLLINYRRPASYRRLMN